MTTKLRMARIASELSEIRVIRRSQEVVRNSCNPQEPGSCQIFITGSISHLGGRSCGAYEASVMTTPGVLVRGSVCSTLRPPFGGI